MVIVMDSEEQMALENIDEFLNDEGKIVTYKFLSLTLSIHVNKSKHLLEEYLKGKKEEEYEVVYFIGGVKQIGSTKAFRFTLVKKDALEDIKGKFDTISTCHIYSIQKSKLKDFDTLYLSDCDLVKQSIHDLHNYSEIQCNFTRREGPVVHKSVSNNISNGDHETKGKLPQQTKVEEKRKTIPPKGKETQAPLFFGSKTITSSKQEKTEVETVAKKPEKKDKKPSGIAGAFSKSKPVTASSKRVEEEIEKKTPVSKEEKIEIDDKEEHNEKTKEKDEKKGRPTKKRKVVMQGSDDEDDFANFLVNTKNKTSDTTKEETKKKKKPVFEDEDDDDVDVVAPTPEPVKKPKSKRRKKEPEKSISPSELQRDKEETSEDDKQSTATKKTEEKTSVAEETNSNSTTGKSRKRRKVMKSKQYINDEGFMVTQKVYESESYSEDSEDDEKKSVYKRQEQQTKKASTELENRAKTHMKKPKTQASIGSFFKRK